MDEQTLVVVKPDGVCKSVTGEIIRRIEAEGFKIVALKMVAPARDRIERFYAPHQGKAFYPGLIEFMLTAPVVALVAQGANVITSIRELIGHRVPAQAQEGTVRGDFGSDGRRNVIHGSDSPESAVREIACFFDPGEVFSYHGDDWLKSEAG